MRQELESCDLLAVDLEYHNALPGVDGCVIISLIQISTHVSDYIIDCFMLRDILRSEFSHNSIKSLFADATVTKILHGCDSDLKYLVADLDIVICNLFDTARAF